MRWCAGIPQKYLMVKLLSWLKISLCVLSRFDISLYFIYLKIFEGLLWFDGLLRPGRVYSQFIPIPLKVSRERRTDFQILQEFQLSNPILQLPSHLTSIPPPALFALLEEHEGDSDSLMGHINEVHSEAELYAMIGDQDAVVKLAFTWCQPCKAFLPRYQKFAKIYPKTRFLKIVGNENESCKHYAKEVLHVACNESQIFYPEPFVISRSCQFGLHRWLLHKPE